MGEHNQRKVSNDEAGARGRRPKRVGGIGESLKKDDCPTVDLKEAQT